MPVFSSIRTIASGYTDNAKFNDGKMSRLKNLSSLYSGPNWLFRAAQDMCNGCVRICSLYANHIYKSIANDRVDICLIAISRSGNG